MSRQLKIIAACFVIVSTALIIYAQVVNFSLVEHEDTTIYLDCKKTLENKNVLHMLSVFPGHYAYWIPVTYLSFLADFLVWGDAPGKHHLSPLIYHILNGLLLFALFQAMTGKIMSSTLLSTLFVIHPLNVEAVAFLAPRSTLLSTFFVLLTLLAYVHYVRCPGLINYLLVVLCFSLGLMAKPSIVHLPILLVIIDYWPLNRFPGISPPSDSQRPGAQALFSWIKQPAIIRSLQLFKEKIPLLLISVICFIGNSWYTKTHFIPSNYFQTNILPSFSPFLQQAVNKPPSIAILLQQTTNKAPILYLGYLWKTFWPINLSFYIPTTPLRTLAWWETGGALLLLILITLLTAAFRNRAPYLLAGWLWYFITISPQVVNNALLGNFITDHYAYLSIIGLLVMIVWGGGYLLTSYKPVKMIFPAICLALLITLTIMSWRQAAHWRNQITLYEHALSIEPKSVFLHNNLAKALYEQGDSEAAIEHLEQSLLLQPDSINTLTNLGIAYYAAGDMLKTENVFLRALSIAPENFDINQKLAAFYRAAGEHEKAIHIYKKLLEIRTYDSADICYNLASIYAIQNKTEDAIKWLKKSIEHGFTQWDLLKSDKNMQNLQDTDFYRSLIKSIPSLKKS